MVTRHPIQRLRHAQFAFSAEAVQAYRDFVALGDECTCEPRPSYPPWEGDGHPDPNDPVYKGFYSRPPDDCPMCEARFKASTKIRVLGGFKPWWRSKEVDRRMTALAIAAGFESGDDEED
jgi:hypothetical protein